MKVTKEQLEKMVLEAVQAEVGQLNEEELEELLGGLKGMFGAAGKGIAKGAQAVGSGIAKGVQAVGGAVKGAGQAVGQAIGGAAQKAGQAVSGAAQKAGAAVKGAYQAGETKAAVDNVKKTVQNVAAAVDKALPLVQSDPETSSMLQGLKTQVADAQAALQEAIDGKPKKWRRKQTQE